MKFNLITKLSWCSLAICLAVFGSATANATSVKFLLAPGGLLEFANLVDVETELKAEDNAKAHWGFGVAVDFGTGPHKIALDYYSRARNDLEETENIAIPVFFTDGTTGVVPGEGTVETTHSLEALLLGYRYHARSGFYIGGGALIADGWSSTCAELRTSATITGETVTLERICDEGVSFEQGVGGLGLTLGSDWALASNVILGVHMMSSLSGSLVNENDPDEKAASFSILSINFGLGYRFN